MIIRGPNPGPQTRFLESPLYEVLYGGRKKTGKTAGVVLLPLRDVKNPDFRCITFRREVPDLAYVEDVARQTFFAAAPDWFAGGKNYNQQKHLFTFPAPDGGPGAQVRYAFCKNKKDLENYQGHKYQLIIWDELTQWEDPDCYFTMMGELLAHTDEQTGVTMQPRVRSTTNPGGVGHSWVKSRWEISRFPEGNQLLFDEETGLYRMFIPGTAADTPQVDHNQLLKQLKTLPPWKYRALALGSWNIADGAMFEEYNGDVHECEPFEVPAHYDIDCSIDFGYSSYSAVLYWATNPDNRATVCIGELYLTKHTGTQLARRMLDYEEQQGWRIRNRVIDPSVRGTEGTDARTVHRDMWDAGVPCRLANNDRLSGWQAIHDRLNTMIDLPDGRTICALRLMRGRCPITVEQLPTVQRIEGTDDVDKKRGNDHCADAVRYHVMGLAEGPVLTEDDRFAEVPPPSSGYAPYETSLPQGY